MYNAKNIEEIKGLPADKILDGVIIGVIDGKVKEFINPEALNNWKGDLNSNAINVDVEILHDNTRHVITQMFTYIDEDGKVKFPTRSNLGKYIKKYDKAPEVEDKVLIQTDGDGFAKIKLK
jgi:hypothetical protein